MRALFATTFALALALVLAACDPEATTPLNVTLPAAPRLQDVLYAPQATPTTKGLAFLPADTSVTVVVQSVASIIDVVGMARAFDKGGEPYDHAIAALSSWAAGVAIDDAAGLSAAGLDIAAPWGAAWLDLKPNAESDRRDHGVTVVFGPVRDEAKLVARLRASVAERDKKLIDEPLGEGRWYRSNEDDAERALVVRDGTALFVKGARAADAAKVIASLTDEASLRPAFDADVARLAFGRRAIAYVRPRSWIARAIAFLEAEHATTSARFERVAKDLAELEGKDDPNDDEREELTRLRRRMTDKEHDLAFPTKRIAALKQLDASASAIAVGFDATLTTIRAKAFVATSTPILRPMAAPLLATLRGAQRSLGAIELSVEPAYLRELLVVGVGAHEVARVERALREAGIDVDAEALSSSDGRVALMASERRGKPFGVLSLGIGDDAKAQALLQRWLASEQAKRAIEDKTLRVDDDGKSLTWLVADQPLYRVSLRAGSLVLTRGVDAGTLPEPGSWWLAAEKDPLIAPLADLDAHGVVTLDARYADQFSLPRAWAGRAGFPFRGFDRTDFNALLMPASEFGLMGVFGRSRPDDEEQKRIERLRKKKSEILGEIETLKRRQSIARDTGGKRLITALGTSVARIEVVEGGVNLYGAQRIDEPNLATIGEWALWSLVDGSSASPTGRELIKLDKQLAAVERALDKALESAMSHAVPDVLTFGAGFGAGDRGVFAFENPDMSSVGRAGGRAEAMGGFRSGAGVGSSGAVRAGATKAPSSDD
jgi:hypothetical protein